MFLLNNIHNRPYRALYPSHPKVIYDITDDQLRNSKNHDWLKIVPGSVVCIIQQSRRVSTFYQVEKEERTDVPDEAGGFTHVLHGHVAGKLTPEQDMTSVLTAHGVRHPHLPGNKFSIGFNVADLGAALDDLKVRTATGTKTLAEIKSELGGQPSALLHPGRIGP